MRERERGRGGERGVREREGEEREGERERGGREGGEREREERERGRREREREMMFYASQSTAKGHHIGAKTKCAATTNTIIIRRL